MSVNYLIEINALDDWELTHPLSATAYKVMRKLVYLANKERFPERMTVPNTVLLSLVGCSEDSLIKARNQLIQAGLITYKGQKKMTPLYFIHYFSLNPVYNPKIQSIEQGIKQGIKQGMEQGFEPGIKQGTLLNQNEEKKETKGEEESSSRYMERHGIPLGASQYQTLIEFYSKGISDAMIRLAVDEAVEYNKISFAYIRTVINDWIDTGIFTLEDALKRQTAFRLQRKNGPASKTVSAQQYTQRHYSEDELDALGHDLVEEARALRTGT